MLAPTQDEIPLVNGKATVEVILAAKKNATKTFTYTITFTVGEEEPAETLPTVTIAGSATDSGSSTSNDIVVTSGVAVVTPNTVSGSAVTVTLTATMNQSTDATWSISSVTWYQADSANAEGTPISDSNANELVYTFTADISETKYYYVKLEITYENRTETISSKLEAKGILDDNPATT